MRYNLDLPDPNDELVNNDRIDILLDPKFEDINKAEIKKVAKEAVEIIKQHYPKWVPKEDFTLIVLNTSAETGRYVGKWEGNHKILITVAGKEDLQNPHKRLSLTLTIAHELLHQRVAEIIKVDDPNGLELEKKLKFKPLESMSPFEKAETLTFSGIAKASRLQKIINEGCAVYGELQILSSLLKNSTVTLKQKQSILNLQILRTTDLIKKQGDRQSTYYDGYYLILKILAIFPNRNLDEIIAQVDWDACGNIDSSSSDFNAIISNPALIPGIE